MTPSAPCELSIAVGPPARDEDGRLNLARTLIRAVESRPDGKFELVDESLTAITFIEMLSRARRMLSGLRKDGCRPHDCLLLDAGSVRDFIPALWATLLGGMVAVPVRPGSWSANSHQDFREKLGTIAAKVEIRRIICRESKHFEGVGRPIVNFQELDSRPETDETADSSNDDTAILILTSGTTGRPQLVSLSGRAIRHRWWPSEPLVGDATSFLSWLPLDHIMGLGLASPNHRLKVHLDPETFVRQPESWLKLLSEKRVTHSVMTNFAMKLVIDLPNLEQQWNFSNLKRVGVGAEAISPIVCNQFARLLHRFGAPKDSVYLGYGLSECGPVAGGNVAYDLSESSSFSTCPPIDEPTPGHSIRIVDDYGKVLPRHEVGRIEVCGPTVTSGYFNDDRANEALFTPDGWIRTGDLGRLDGNTLTVIGREKEVIVVNASKVSLLEIEEVLAQIDEVSEAYAAILREEGVGKDRLAVAYVSTSPSPELEGEIRRSVFERFGFGLLHCKAISPAEVPRVGTGKVQRHKLGNIFTRREESLSGRFDQGSPVVDRVRHLMSRHLDGILLPPEANFFHFGADSLTALLLATEIEKTFGVAFPPATLGSASTPRKIAEYIENAALKTAQTVSVAPVRFGKEDRRLFLMPGVYNHNGYANVLGSAFRREEEIWTFHISIPGGAAAPYHSLKELAITYAEAMRSIHTRGPFHIAGHSFGALVAFEVAAYLLSQGEHVETLVVIDNMAPVHLNEIGVAMGPSPESVAGYNLYLADKNISDPIDVPILYLRARESPFLCLSDHSAGWNFLSTKGVTCVDIPGDHHSIVRGSNCELLAESISSFLDKEALGTSVAPIQVPQKVRAKIKQANSCRIEGDIDGAISQLASAIALRPHLPYWAYAELTSLLFAARRIPEAEKFYKKTLKRDPWPIATKWRFLPHLMQAKLADHVHAAYSDAQTLNVDTVAAARVKADILLICQAWEPACRCLLEGLKIFPESIELRTRLASVLLAQRKNAEAAGHVEKALQFEPLNDAALNELGRVANRLGRDDLAERCIQRSLQISPDGEPEAFEIMRTISLSRGENEIALSYEQKRDRLRLGRRFRSA